MKDKSRDKKGGFSAREARALVWLLPVLAVAVWLVREISQPKIADNPTETTADYEQGDSYVAADGSRESVPGPDGQAVRGDGEREAETGWQTAAETGSAATGPFVFDPNTIEYHDLMRLGFTRGEALGIVKYRERGKVFEIPEDFAACYQVSEAMYRRLEPYIVIGERFKLEPFARRGGQEADVPAQYSEAATSTPQYSQAAGDSKDLQARPAVVRPAGGQPFGGQPVGGRTGGVRPALVDLNTADSAALISVAGIGVRTVLTIMEYRERLGGFAAVEQLAEVRGMTEQNYYRILEQVFVDPAVIQKININFAPAKSLASHPYIGAGALRKLLKERQLKGGWRTPEELEQDDIFTAEELARLSPYLIFN